MRFGFVAASLTVHAAVVGLAWRFAPVGERATEARVDASGLPTDELEVTPWEPTDRDEMAPVAQAPKAASEPEADTPRSATATADVTPLAPAPPAREGAPPKNQTRPKPPSRPAPAKSPATVQADATREQAPRPNADESSGDWMSVDDQLPDAEANEAAKPTSKPEQRDELVERLLAKERDKARLAARDEARREAAQRDQAQREPEQRAAARTAPQLAAAGGEPGPRNPDDANFGDARAHADLWVELTRWLPRAASSDHAWEELPTNSSYEFRVELVTEGGKLVGSRLLDAAPTPTKKLLENTSHLMERGKYGGSKRVTHRYELRIRLSSAEPRDLWIAHTTPDPPKPGVGSFIAPSGRRFDVWVSEVD